MSLFKSLSTYSFVNIDSADLDALQELKNRGLGPHDATTNPSLILKAYSTSPTTKKIVDDVINSNRDQTIESLMNRISVAVGCEILKLIPGRVSTELDARHSFDVEANINQANEIMQLYEEKGVDKKRILFKVACTYEGIQAMRELAASGYHCNATLCFSLPQAIEAAHAHATLVSPFVGRISDWAKKENLSTTEDLGVANCRSIYYELKKYGLSTQVMAASFRTLDQVLSLAGCDLLTVSPELIEQLSKPGDVQPQLTPPQSFDSPLPHLRFSEKEFRWAMNENKMASELLDDGIRRFALDARKLENIVRERVGVEKIRETVSVVELSAGIGF
ncbi:hypothetical protein RCL1_004240 [Eukaryota sp. TZLM3-RCL]